MPHWLNYYYTFTKSEMVYGSISEYSIPFQCQFSVTIIPFPHIGQRSPHTYSMSLILSANYTDVTLIFYHFSFIGERPPRPPWDHPPPRSRLPPRRHQTDRPLWAPGLVHPCDGAAGAVQGPLRLHHFQGVAEREHGQGVLQADRAHGHGLPPEGSHSQGH